MEAPEAARPSGPRLRALKAAGVSAAASSARRDRVASWAADAVLRLLFVAAWVGTVAGVVPSIAGPWIGGAAGCAVSWLGDVAFMAAWCVLRYLALLAVPLCLLRSSGGGYRSTPRSQRGEVWAWCVWSPQI